MMSETIAILSPGEMGHAIGRTLVNHGFPVITSLAGRSRRTAGLTREAGIEDVGDLDAVVDQADIILSIMPSFDAPVVAADVASRLSGRETPLLFVDCNALAPQTAQGIERTITDAGGLMADVGIIGGPPTDTYQPRLYASGPHLDRLLDLGASGLDFRPIGINIGQASGMKMCYAALTKGLSALGTSVMVAAAKLELTDPLRDELVGSQTPIFNWLQKTIPGMPPKSRRWVSEMEEIAATLGHLGLPSGFHLGAADVYRRVGETRLAQESPESRDTSRTMRAAIEEMVASQKL